MIKKFLDGTLTALAYGIATLVGVVLAAATFVWHFIPKRDRERQAREKQAADQKAAAVAPQVAAIQQAADGQRAQDSVALANELLKE